VEPGETLVQAAVRETWEEAGIEIRPHSLLRFDHQWLALEGSYASKWRFVLVASPVGPADPKSEPDHHSLEVRWIAPADLAGYPLRDFEVVPLILHVDGGGPLTPLSVYNSVPLPPPYRD